MPIKIEGEASQQGSPAWKQFRKLKIGASLAPSIIGANRFCTPYQLWKQLIDDVEIPENEDMIRGKTLESYAREEYNDTMGTFHDPMVFVHDDYPWLYCSLDGWDWKELIEIKAPRKLSDAILQQKIPDYYFPQVQHQLMIMGCQTATYMEMAEGTLRWVKVERDDAYIAKLLEKEKEFYRCLIEFDPPPLTEKDIRIQTSEEALQLAQKRESNLIAMDALSEENKAIEERLKGFVVDDMPTKVGTLTIRQVSRRGNIEYSKIPALQGINLDEYRKPASKYWRFS